MSWPLRRSASPSSARAAGRCSRRGRSARRTSTATRRSAIPAGCRPPRKRPARTAARPRAAPGWQRSERPGETCSCSIARAGAGELQLVGRRVRAGSAGAPRGRIRTPIDHSPGAVLPRGHVATPIQDSATNRPAEPAHSVRIPSLQARSSPAPGAATRAARPGAATRAARPGTATRAARPGAATRAARPSTAPARGSPPTPRTAATPLRRAAARWPGRAPRPGTPPRRR